MVALFDNCYILFQHGCHWELYWSHGLAGNWQAAAESMKILVDGSFWSPAVINYLYAIVLVRIITGHSAVFSPFALQKKSPFHFITVNLA